MKIYTNTFDLSRPAPHRFWVPPYSDFKIGIKLVDAGREVEADFSVAAGTTELIADATKIDGFTIYTLNSTDTGFVEYTITVEGLLQKLKLVQIVSDSTVFDIDERGGDMSQYATKNWVEAEISGFVDTDDLTAYATADELTAYATKDELTGYVENDDLTAYYTKSETSSATELADAFAGAGGGAISAFDLSESPVLSKTQVEAALANNICLPQTVVQYNDNSLSVADIVGEVNFNADKEIKKLLIGTNCTGLRNASFFQYSPKETVFSSTVSAITTEYWLNGLNGGAPIVIPDTVKTIYSIRYNDSAFPYMDFGNTRTSMPDITNPSAIPGSGRKYYVPDALYDTVIATAPWSSIKSMVYRHSDLTAPSKVTNLSSVSGIMKISQADYDVLSAGGTADANTLYVIV